MANALSSERLEPYIQAADGDRTRALHIYEWNSRLCASFYIPLQSVEIGFRNACHRELTASFGDDWYDRPPFLEIERFRIAIAEAKDSLTADGYAVDTPHIVAQLHFGVWTHLLSRRFEHRLWTPSIRKAFPRFRRIAGRSVTRRTIADTFKHVRVFRNRIAHHEPIFKRDLRADFQMLIRIAEWMYDDLATWTESQSSCRAIIAEGKP